MGRKKSNQTNKQNQSILTYVLGAQKNRLIETVLLSTHNICFVWEIRKLNFRYALLTKVLDHPIILQWYTDHFTAPSNPLYSGNP